MSTDKEKIEDLAKRLLSADGNVFWPGGKVSMVSPGVVSNRLRELRQKIADTKAGQVIARELGIKPKTVTLPAGETVEVTGSSGLLPWLLGGTNPSAPAFRTSRALRKLPVAERLLQEAPENPSHNLFRAKVYHGGPVEDPYFAFYTTDPKYAAQYGDISPYLLEAKGAATAKEPLIGSRDVVTNDMFIDANTRGVGNPDAKAIIGHDMVTSDMPYSSNGLEVLSLDPKNVTPLGEAKSTISLAEGLRALSESTGRLSKPVEKTGGIP